MLDLVLRPPAQTDRIHIVSVTATNIIRAGTTLQPCTLHTPDTCSYKGEVSRALHSLAKSHVSPKLKMFTIQLLPSISLAAHMIPARQCWQSWLSLSRPWPCYDPSISRVQISDTHTHSTITSRSNSF